MSLDNTVDSPSVDSALDERLRDVLRDNGFELPGWDDPVGRVASGIRRRRRHRLVLASTVTCILAALLLAIPAVLWPGYWGGYWPGYWAGPTPGVDSPIAFPGDAEVPAPAHLARRSPRADAKPCTELAEQAWMEGSTVMLPNASSHRCTLRDGAAQTVLSVTNAGTGLREVFTSGSATPRGAWQSPATIDPGEPARLDITAGNGCGQRFEDFVLSVLGRSYELDLSTDCPPSLTGWYVEPPLLNAPLTVTMKAPTTVQRGQFFDYVVTVLSVPGTFKLRDCPVYLQRLGTRVAWRRLNCDRLKAFPAHTPVSFTMRAYVPPDQPPGSTKLSWMAVMSDGTVAIANLATDGVKVDVI